MKPASLSEGIVRAAPRTLAWALTIALTTPARAAPNSWPVEYGRGDLAYVASHKNLTLEVNGGSIRVLRGEETLRTIPGGSVVSVVYDVATYHPAVGYLKSGSMPPPSGEGWAAAPVAALTVLVVVVIPMLLAPVAKSQHFVTLVWKEGDLVRNVTLQVKGKDRQAILAAMGAASGTTPRDGPVERDQLAAELDAAKSRSFALDLDRDVCVADTYVDKGTHRAVVLDRGGGRELILFEDGSYKPKNALLAVPVQVAAATPETSAPAPGAPAEKPKSPGSGDVKVTYQETPGGSTIRQLRVGEQLLTLPEFVVTPPGTPRPVPGTDGKVVEIAYGQFSVGTITRTEYEGEQAFRFLAIRLDFNFSMNPYPAADLYITPGRVVFDLGDTEAARKRHLSLPRHAITEVRSGIGQINNQAMIRLTVDKRTHTFRLRAPGLGQPATSTWPFDHGRTRLVETRLADFARLAIRDFQAAVSLYDGWLAGVPALAPSEPEEPTPTADESATPDGR